MPWTQNKHLKIRFAGNKEQFDRVVHFEIAEQNRAEFYRILEYFLAGIKTNEGVVTDAVEQYDPESKEVYELEIKIIGTRDKMLSMMNQYGPDLTKVAVGVKQYEG